MNEPKDFSYDELMKFARALLAENMTLRAELRQTELAEQQRCARVCRHVIDDWSSHPCIDAIADAMEDAIRGINRGTEHDRN